MPAWEVLSYTGSAGSVTSFGTQSPVGSDPASVRYFSNGQAKFLNVFAQSDAAGEGRIFANDWHDTTNGIRFNIRSINQTQTGTGSTGLSGGTVSDLLLDDEFYQPLNSQASLTIQASGSSTGLGLINWYSSLDGITQKLTSPDALRGHILNRKTLVIPVASGFGYSTTSTAFNAFDTTLHGNTYYAVAGYGVGRADCLTVGLKGNFTGNLHLGGPGTSFMPWVTRNIFVRLSRLTGMPMVPYFNSADQANCFVEIANSGGISVAPIISLNLLETDFTS